MAGRRFPVFTVVLCLLLLWPGYGGVAQIEQVTEQPQSREQQQRPQEMIKRGQECRIESLTSLEPSRRVESEAGFTDYWDETNQQLECAGVSVIRQTIMQRGLLLPTYSNAPRLAYIVQGSGITGELISGCPETFQSFRQPQQGGKRAQGSIRDQHQKIRNFREGDILAIPGGVAHWCYNDGQNPVVFVAVFDTRNSANQLDSNLRSFRLAGNQPGSARGGSSYPAYGEESSRGNIFSGFDTQTLAEAFGVSQETARKIQNRDDRRGNIVHVDEGLQVVRPGRREYQEGEEEHRGRSNGLDEVLCNMKLIENIDDPTRADFYSPEAGRISSLNSFKLPILSQLRMSAERGVLYREALLPPLWSTNAHSVVYVTKGPGRVQIIGNHGRPVFDGELRQGQLVIVPQNFAVTKQAGSEGFDWVAFKTAEDAMSSPLVGKASALRGMPDEVLMNAYRISRQEARSLKQNRDQEVMVFSPVSRSQGGRSAT